MLCLYSKFRNECENSQRGSTKSAPTCISMITRCSLSALFLQQSFSVMRPALRDMPMMSSVQLAAGSSVKGSEEPFISTRNTSTGSDSLVDFFFLSSSFAAACLMADAAAIAVPFTQDRTCGLGPSFVRTIDLLHILHVNWLSRFTRGSAPSSYSGQVMVVPTPLAVSGIVISPPSVTTRHRSSLKCCTSSRFAATLMLTVSDAPSVTSETLTRKRELRFMISTPKQAGTSDSFLTLSVFSTSLRTWMSPHLICGGVTVRLGPIPLAMHWTSSGSSSCPTTRKNMGSWTRSSRSVLKETVTTRCWNGSMTPLG
mmetsp:Transcript_18836/g.39713  ORF Transcript_18836/g.39713 Transcript_18836/m.39713 type:complete len:313 (-) Transcript_18836:177-1115(-)